MKQKKPLMIGIGAVIILLAGIGGVYAFKKGNSNNQPEASPTSQKTKITLPVNQIPVEDRPYVYISPKADGRNASITVASLPKAATEVEYELEYQAGSLIQAAFGLIDLPSLPASETILFGTCSAGGACTYHDDVKGGSLVLKFSGEEEYTLKEEWKYLDLRQEDDIITSKDAKFQISTENIAGRFAIIYNSPGYPEGVDGTVVSEIYSLQTSSTENGSAELSIRANEAGDLTIMGYDGETWQSFETTNDEKQASAEVELMEAYVVVQ